MKFKLKYEFGDCLKFTNSQYNNYIIPHVCNDIGAWGSGFVLALNKFSPIPKQVYLESKPYRLGSISLAKPLDNVYVCNMIAQKGTGPIYHGEHKIYEYPLKYSALEECLRRLKIEIIHNIKPDLGKNIVYSPMFGAGLAGGNWDDISHIIYETFYDIELEWTVFRYIT